MTLLFGTYRTFPMAFANSSSPPPFTQLLIQASSSISFHNFQSHHILNRLNLNTILSEYAKGKEAEIMGEEGCKCSNGVSEFVSRKCLSDDIMPHILNLYAATATPRDFEIYAPDTSFEDPLMCAHGVKQIKSAFYSLSKVFSESRIVEYDIKENLTSPGKGEILIDNKQHYKFWGRNIDMISLIKLYVVDGKVVRHEDWWDKKPLWNRETFRLPLIGRVFEVTRRGSMLATHAMMGFGKDPTM